METWDLDYPDGHSETWTKDGISGQFRLVHYNGLGADADQYSTPETAELAGARLCSEGNVTVAYPGVFRYSPVTGKPLSEPLVSKPETWLPPFGRGHTPDPFGMPGLRQTHVNLGLPRGLKPEHDPGTLLPLPPPGDYQFFVGNLAARRASLLAIAPRKGMLYVFRDSAKHWVEVRGTHQLLPESTLSTTYWGLACPDSTKQLLYLPTDRGLALLDINIFNLSYDLRLFPGRCMGAPVCFHGKRVFVPVIAGPDQGGILQVDTGNPTRVDQLEIKHYYLAEPFTVTLVDHRRIIWLSRLGQLILKFEDNTNKPTTLFIPWPAGFQPSFQFGSPYRARDGVLWQLGFDQQQGRYEYLTLASTSPERQETASPRLGSGTINFALETQLRSHPWLDPETVTDAASRHIVAPLLESPNKSALCVRIPWNQGADDLFNSKIKHATGFRLVTEHGDIDFFMRKLTRPWLTRSFVYRNEFYLYHPDFDQSIPGWKLLSC
ncbi:hypothetical protein [uncultured Thiodictyon sp.]|uniref:hypothetical protein n=1 Tax=uncultured Thiodictyon sp. TaxID=1846217 RepID=UPI0025E7BF59|nr:hypothetical protein [uncultured Thiodictyon sp.]